MVNNLGGNIANKKVYLLRAYKNSIALLLYPPMGITYISLIYTAMIYMVKLW